MHATLDSQITSFTLLTYAGRLDGRCVSTPHAPHNEKVLTPNSWDQDSHQAMRQYLHHSDSRVPITSDTNGSSDVIGTTVGTTNGFLRHFSPTNLVIRRLIC